MIDGKFGYRTSSDVAESISSVNFTSCDNSQMIDGKFGYRTSSGVTESISTVNFTAYDNSQMIDGKPVAKVLRNLTACVKKSLFFWYVLTKLTSQDDRENGLEI